LGEIQAFQPLKQGRSYTSSSRPECERNIAHRHALTNALAGYFGPLPTRLKEKPLRAGADHPASKRSRVRKKHRSPQRREEPIRFVFTREELYGRIWDFVVRKPPKF
jgi:hypothetical protein